MTTAFSRMAALAIVGLVAGCATGTTKRYDAETGNLIFKSSATGTGASVQKAQKSVSMGAPNTDEYFSLKAGVQGLDAASALMVGMQMTQQMLGQWAQMNQTLKMYEMANPKPSKPSATDRLTDAIISGGVR